MAFTERYVVPNGAGAQDGTSEANAWASPAAAIAAAPAAGTRINVKAGNYANTTTDLVFSNAGTAIAPIWWRGYNTTPGDCDADPTLIPPTISWTTARGNVTGAHQVFSSILFTGARAAGYQVTANAAPVRFFRCQFINTASAAASEAFLCQTSGAGMTFVLCYFKATGTASHVFETSVPAALNGCIFEGGGDGLYVTGNMTVVLNSLFRSNGAHGINWSSNSNLIAANCTFASPGGDGVRIVTGPGIALLSQNLFVGGTYGINNATGGNISVARTHNDFFNQTTAAEVNLGDSPSFSQLAESSNPFTNAAGGDYSPLASAAAKAGGMGRFTGGSFSSYLDVGAVQRQEPAGGGSGSVTGLFRGILNGGSL